MNSLATVLIIEDDIAVQRLLTIALQEYQFKTIVCGTKEEALKVFKLYPIDLVLLDLGLPDDDGKTVIQFVRKISSSPIIILSARDHENEIVQCLNLGADDYITKPFSTKELLARLQANFRRSAQPQDMELTMLECGDIKLDLSARSVLFHEQFVKLAPKEYKLFEYLMRNINCTLSHQQILKQVWGIGYQNEMQYLRTHINVLRNKFETDPTRPIYIKTIHGIGYRLECCS